MRPLDFDTKTSICNHGIGLDIDLTTLGKNAGEALQCDVSDKRMRGADRCLWVDHHFDNAASHLLWRRVADLEDGQVSL